MKALLVAIPMMLLVGMCAAGLAKRTGTYTSKTTSASTACSKRATLDSMYECKSRCARSYSTGTVANDSCRERCEGSAAAYLRGCELSGGVLP